MNRSEILSLMYDPTAAALYVVILFSLFSPIGLGNLDVISSIVIGALFLKIIPAIPFFYYLKIGYVDVNLTVRKRRLPLFIVGSISSIISIVIFYVFDVKILFIFSIAYFVGSSVVGLITRFWKISMHTYGIAGGISALVYVYGVWMVPLYILLVPVMYVRYKEKLHDIKQLMIGTILASVVTYMIYFVLW